MAIQDKIPDVKILFGKRLTRDDMPPVCSDEKDIMLTFFSDNNLIMDVTESQLSKHTLLIGGIGSGKTNCFNFIVSGLNGRMTSKDVMLIFDTKGDFYGKFFDKRSDCVIGNSWNFLPVTSYWNIFREIEFGGRLRSEKELMAKEIAKSLFEDRKNESQPFFSNAACDIFGKTLLHIMRGFWDQPEYRRLETEMEENQGNPYRMEDILSRQHALFEKNAGHLNNRYLVKEVLQKWTAQQYVKMLHAHKDFESSVSYIGEGTSNQALGVFGEMNSMINDYFIGVFADYVPGRDISMRELIHQKGGRKIFIEYDLSVGSVLCCIYRLLVDLALKEALGRDRSDGNVFLIIDEFKLLPKLTHLDDALNFGRSLGIKAFVGIQNIGQLEDIYGEAAGKVIAAGFSNVFAFRMTDEASRTYVSELFGANYTSIEFWNSRGDKDQAQREGHCVEGWQLMDLRIGEAVVGLIGCDPFYFRFLNYDVYGG
ncbi:MAG: type IV secretion system DNA-binding domain-containing protein [Lachnospiraceae bacterium]|nr:type IV secretion system DNA-binding domain-containing protein [Lachnospiraceae bacterium]